LNDNRRGAESYYKTQKDRFLSDEKMNEAEILLQNTIAGFKLAQYYQLYK
jgi:hypothetical protein